jgi:DNA polymerase I
MQIRLRTGITLRQGTFSAVIAPERTIIAALNDNPELGRFLFLFVCGNYSRLISHIGRSSSNFEVRRPFTADQFLTVVKEAGHTIIFIEHDPTIFESAERLIAPVGSALKEAGREALVVLYSPVMDKPFSALARQADRLIEIVNVGEPDPRQRPAARGPGRKDTDHQRAQTTLAGL